MSNFLYNGTSLPTNKVDLSIPAVPANAMVTSGEWNTVSQAVMDVKAVVGVGAVSVKAFLSGDGSSSSDCYAAVNAAISAATAAGGSNHIHFPAGTYVFDLSAMSGGPNDVALITIPSGMSVTGEGFASILKMTGVTPGPFPNGGAQNLFGVARGARGITFRGLHFVGENGVGDTGFVRPQNNQSSAIQFIRTNTPQVAYDTTIEQCVFDNLWGFSGQCATFSQGTIIRNNWMRWCGNGWNISGDGVLYTGNYIYKSEGIEAAGNDSVFADNTFVQVIGAALSIGGYNDTTTRLKGNVIRGNVIDGVVTYDDGAGGQGIVLADALCEFIVDGNFIRGVPGFAILVSSPVNPFTGYGTISNNTITNCTSNALPGSVTGIYLPGAGHNVVRGNTLRNDGASGQWSPLIGLNLSSNNNLVQGNVIDAQTYAVAFIAGVTGNRVTEDNVLSGGSGPINWDVASTANNGMATVHVRAPADQVSQTLWNGAIAPNYWPLFNQYGTGKMEFGPGNTPVDTNLYRAAAARLQTDGEFAAAWLRLTGQSSAPPSPVAGNIYYNSVDHALHTYQGARWGQVSTDLGVNVRAFLAGDGTSSSDCYAAVNAAIAQATAQGLNHIHFPAGTYTFDLSGLPSVSTSCLFSIPSGFLVTGDGHSSALNVSGIGGASNGDVGKNLFGIAIGTVGTTIRGLRFIGNNGTGSTGYTWVENNQSGMIDFTADFVHGVLPTDVVIESCEFDNLWGFSIHCQGFSHRTSVLFCSTRYCANGINLNGGESIQGWNTFLGSEGIECTGPGNLFIGNTFIDCYSAAMSIGGDQTAGTRYYGNVITGNSINGVSKPGYVGRGIILSDATIGAVVTGNSIARTTGCAILTITTTGGTHNGWHSITGNSCYACSGAGSGVEQAVISITADGHSIVSDNNITTDLTNQPTFNPNTGIYFSSPNNIARANLVDGMSGYGLGIADGIDNTNLIADDNIIRNSPYKIYWSGHTNGYNTRETYDPNDIVETRHTYVDPFQSFIERANGKHEWGDGRNIGPVDTNLYRAGVAQLKTDGLMMAAGTANAFYATTNGAYGAPGSAKLWSDGLGAGSTDIAVKIGVPMADSSVNANAKLFSARTGISFTEAEYAYISKSYSKIFANSTGAVLGIQNNNASGFSGIEYYDQTGAVAVFTGYANSGTGQFRFNNIASGGHTDFMISGQTMLSIDNSGRQDIYGTDSSGTPGAATINKPSGISAIASGASTVVITNSTVGTGSRVMITWNGDHGAARWWVTRAAGSFTVNLSANATANTSFSWEVHNLI